MGKHESDAGPYGPGIASEIWRALGADAAASRLVNTVLRRTDLPQAGDGRSVGEVLAAYREEMPDWRNIGRGIVARVDAYLNSEATR